SPPDPDLPSSRTRLTPRGWALLAFSVGAIVLGAILPEPAAVQLGMLGLFLPLITWPVAARNLKGLAITRTHPPSAFAGQLFPYTLEVHQSLPRRSSGVEIEDTVSGPAERGMDVLHVAPESTASRSFHTRLLRRGPRHRARAILTSTWPLGLWTSTREIRDSLEMIIYPRPVTPRSLDDAQDAALIDAEEEESARRDWSGDFHGIRAFQPGDRLKLIHWPATARAGRMMVRQFDRRLPEKYSIVFHSIHPGKGDAGTAGPDAFESALELLCGLVLHCRDQDIPFDLTASYDHWRCLQVPNPSQPEPALNRLAGARRRPDRDPSPLLHALSTTEPGARVFLLSDVPVREWEHLLPELPFAVTCLSVMELRIKRPGLLLRSRPASA
ncbi:MAG: hypothetical protein JWL81_877, partial [Verrucomicrobiales bacterium]|nr:hypothetical protein [Verrucomicrobiales bacterium]